MNTLISFAWRSFSRLTGFSETSASAATWEKSSLRFRLFSLTARRRIDFAIFSSESVAYRFTIGAPGGVVLDG